MSGVKELREQARELGVTVPRGASEEDLRQLVSDAEAAADPVTGRAAPESVPAASQEAAPQKTEDHRPNDPLGEAPDEGDGDGPTREIRRKIEHVNERGDWTDPFSGLVTFHGNDRNPQSGAIRQGDTAVLTVPKD
jgi:hypothetical protein